MRQNLQAGEDPSHPRASQEVPLEHRLEIVDALGECGADFSATPGHTVRGISNYPPLAAGYPSGRPLDIMTQLRARGLLYGADPTKITPFWNGLDLKEEKLLGDFTLSYYIEKAEAGVKLSPTTEVMAWLKKLAAAKGIELKETVQKVEEKAERKRVSGEEKKETSVEKG